MFLASLVSRTVVLNYLALLSSWDVFFTTLVRVSRRYTSLWSASARNKCLLCLCCLYCMKRLVLPSAGVLYVSNVMKEAFIFLENNNHARLLLQGQVVLFFLRRFLSHLFFREVSTRVGCRQRG